MAIPNLKTRIKSNLKKEIENENNKGGDKRFLNFFDLKEGEKMTILFLPDVEGEFWAKFSKHGPQLTITGSDGKKRGVRGAGSINCAYKSSGEECPACQKGFDLFSASKDAGGDKFLKDEGKKWMPRDYTLVSCIVLESPVEVTADDKGNQVKLMYLPYAIENIIKEAITEGQVEEDELCTTPFVIKKTTNSGGWASYENSYFSRKQVDEDDLEYLEDLVVEQFDYSSLDIIPPATTTEEVQAWLEKAEEAYEKAQRGGSSSSSDGDDDRPIKKQTSKLDMLGKKRKPKFDDVEDETPAWEEEESVDEGEEEQDNGEEEQQDAKSDVRSRLAALKKRK